MKYVLCIILSVILSSASYSQTGVNISFDNLNYKNFVFIDTTDTDNIWQVGSPHKTYFQNASSLPNAIVTDTINPYPTNDTSSFIFKFIMPEEIGSPESSNLNFTYKIDADSLTDYGFIEFSTDNGRTWVNYNTDTLYNNYYTISETIFTGHCENWKSGQIHNIIDTWAFWINMGDTIIYKFTFISDSIQTGKDGWIIDNISLGNIYENIEENNISTCKLFPNPVNDIVSIIIDEKLIDENVSIYSNSGQLIKIEKIINKTINLKGLNNGMYIIGVNTEKGKIFRKLIVNKQE